MKKMIIIFLCSLLSACGGGGADKGLKPVRVEASIANKMEVPIYIDTIGNIVERSIVQIRPQVPGILLKSYVKEGQEVKKGELLYEIDPRPYQAAFEEAVGNLEKDKASLEQAKITVQRNQELVEKKYIPLLTFEQYETNVKTAEAQVKISEANVNKAKINLDYCNITSPINGRVSSFNIYPGNLVQVNDSQAITEIREIDPIDVRFTIPQRDFQRVHQGQMKSPLEFEATLPNEKKKLYKGFIYFIDNHVDLSTGTIQIKGVVENEKRALWPGEFVNVRILLGKDLLVVIPDTAEQAGSKGPFVYQILQDLTVKAVTITTGQPYGPFTTVISGLKEGDKIVTNGQLNLRNGSKVQIVDKGNGG